MSHKGNTQFIMIITPPADQVAEGDRIFESHAKWVEKTNSREGDKALLSYNVAKGTDPENNICFTLIGIFETPAGIVDHSEKGQNWPDRAAFFNWLQTCTVSQVLGSQIIHSLW